MWGYSRCCGQDLASCSSALAYETIMLADQICSGIQLADGERAFVKLLLNALGSDVSLWSFSE